MARGPHISQASSGTPCVGRSKDASQLRRLNLPKGELVTTKTDWTWRGNGNIENNINLCLYDFLHVFLSRQIIVVTTMCTPPPVFAFKTINWHFPEPLTLEVLGAWGPTCWTSSGTFFYRTLPVQQRSSLSMVFGCLVPSRRLKCNQSTAGMIWYVFSMKKWWCTDHRSIFSLRSRQPDSD